MNRCFLSVCVPVYNAGRYLDICIQSIMEQSYQDFELILCDDGSRDNSLSICRDWAARYPDCIRVIAKENTGSLLTRRRCLEEAKGSYIYIMDADDRLTAADALETIKKTIDSTGCDMLFFNCSSEGRERYFDFPFEDMEIFEGSRKEKIYRYLIRKNGLNPLWNKVFRRELVDWDEDYTALTHVTNGTDYFQSIPIVCHAKRICFLNRSLYFYRTEQNAESIVHKFRDTIYISGKTNFLRLRDYAAQWEFTDKDSLLRTACMYSVSTAVYKARLLGKSEAARKEAYIRTIAEDDLIREYFTLAGLPMARKIIVLLVRMRACKLLTRLL